jgi:hypothetical protein
MGSTPEIADRNFPLMTMKPPCLAPQIWGVEGLIGKGAGYQINHCPQFSHVGGQDVAGLALRRGLRLGDGGQDRGAVLGGSIGGGGGKDGLTVIGWRVRGYGG